MEDAEDLKQDHESVAVNFENLHANMALEGPVGDANTLNKIQNEDELTGNTEMVATDNGNTEMVATDNGNTDGELQIEDGNSELFATDNGNTEGELQNESGNTEFDQTELKQEVSLVEQYQNDSGNIDVGHTEGEEQNEDGNTEFDQAELKDEVSLLEQFQNDSGNIDVGHTEGEEQNEDGNTEFDQTELKDEVSLLEQFQNDSGNIDVGHTEGEKRNEDGNTEVDQVELKGDLPGAEQFQNDSGNIDVGNTEREEQNEDGNTEFDQADLKGDLPATEKFQNYSGNTDVGNTEGELQNEDGNTKFDQAELKEDLPVAEQFQNDSGNTEGEEQNEDGNTESDQAEKRDLPGAVQFQNDSGNIDVGHTEGELQNENGNTEFDQAELKDEVPAAEEFQNDSGNTEGELENEDGNTKFDQAELKEEIGNTEGELQNEDGSTKVDQAEPKEEVPLAEQFQNDSGNTDSGVEEANSPENRVDQKNEENVLKSNVLMVNLDAEQSDVEDVARGMIKTAFDGAREQISLEISDVDSQKEAQVKPVDKEPEWLDILGNGLLKKKILKPGEGVDSRPQREQEVTIKYEGKLKSHDEVVESSDKLTFVLGEQDVLAAFDLAVALMEKGEISLVESGAKYAYGEQGKSPKIPPNASVIFEIELLEVKPGPFSATIELERRLAWADEKRQNGNKFYSKTNFIQATIAYTRATKALEKGWMNEESEPGRIRINELRLKCYNNLTAVRMKQEKWKEAMESCRAAEKLEPDNVKMLFRKGKIHCELGQLERGVAVLGKASKLDPDNKYVTTEHAKQKRKLEKQKESQKKMYRRMLGTKDDEITEKSSSPPEQSEDSWFKNWGRVLGGTIALGAVLVGVYIAQRI